MKWGVARLERARREGQRAPGLAVPAALDLLYGPLYARLMTGRRAPTVDEGRAQVELAANAIFVAPHLRARRPPRR